MPYRIVASWMPGDSTERTDCSSAETLGDAMWTRYASRELAQRHAEEMQCEIEDYELDPTTEYAVEEVER